MWNAILQSIDRRLRDKPRKQLLRSTLQLRSRMEKCQKLYDDLRLTNGFRSDVTHGTDEAATNAWYEAVTELTQLVVRLDLQLSIFSPEARRRIREYQYGERFEAEALEVFDSDCGQARQVSISSYSLGESFDTALVELDTFIRQNFSPEEIQDEKVFSYL